MHASACELLLVHAEGMSMLTILPKIEIASVPVSTLQIQKTVRCFMFELLQTVDGKLFLPIYSVFILKKLRSLPFV